MIFKTVIVFGKERRLNKVDSKVASLEVRRAALIDIVHILLKGTRDVIECFKLSIAGYYDHGRLFLDALEVAGKLGFKRTGVADMSFSHRLE